MNHKNYLALILGILLSGALSAQSYNIGIRAGLSQSKFAGPSEANADESFSFSGGWHFGANFQWNFSDVLGLRSEILYNQTGSRYSFRSDDAYYLYRKVLSIGTYPNVSIVGLTPDSRDEWVMLRDKTVIDINYSNSYLQFPQTLHLSLGKFEVFGGAYFGVMLSPLAFGTFKFGEGNPFDNPHIFEQGFDFNYSSDRVAGFNARNRPILLIVNEENTDIPSTIGAYYFIENEADRVSRYKRIDYGVIGGFSYYFNRGLYASLRLEYGLNDITRTLGDVSYQELQPGNAPVYNNDFDRNVSAALSIGFRF